MDTSNFLKELWKYNGSPRVTNKDMNIQCIINGPSMIQLITLVCIDMTNWALINLIDAYILNSCWYVHIYIYIVMFLIHIDIYSFNKK